MDAQCDARPRIGAIFHSIMVHGESDVIESQARRYHICGLFFNALITVFYNTSRVRVKISDRAQQKNASRSARVFD